MLRGYLSNNVGFVNNFFKEEEKCVGKVRL